MEKRIKNTLLLILNDWDVPDDQIMINFQKSKGFTDPGELNEILEDYCDDTFLEEFNRKLNKIFGPLGFNNPWITVSFKEKAKSIFNILPESLFIEAINLNIDCIEPIYTYENKKLMSTKRVSQDIQKLFQTSGVPYKIDNKYYIVPSFSTPQIVLSIDPALTLLEDTPALSQASDYYHQSIIKIRENDLSGCVDKLRMAIEESLVCLIQSKNLTCPPKHQAFALFETLRKGDILPSYSKDLVLSTCIIRNKTSAGHASKPPVTDKEAKACLSAAAASLFYVACFFD